MNHSAVFLYHRIFFVCLTLSIIFLQPFILSALKGSEIIFALFLFFGLGIPHGALDLSLGRFLFQPKFGSRWWTLFLVCYLACVALIVFAWLLYPLPCFLFFLTISALHFGFSDTQQKTKLLYLLEGLARGILLISAPAYFYPEAFQNLVESSLSTEQAALILQILHTLFYPNFFLITALILYGFFQEDLKCYWNSLEMVFILLLFIILTPFKAFLIYFCFLHSLRHIISIFENMNIPVSWPSIKWIIRQAFPSTLCTMFALWLCYICFKQYKVDASCMFNLFFISLAALTFPHMLLVETVKLTRPN